MYTHTGSGGGGGGDGGGGRVESQATWVYVVFRPDITEMVDWALKINYLPSSVVCLYNV